MASAALCCTAFAYPAYEDYQYTGQEAESHENGANSYQPVASQRIGVHEIGGHHEDEHVDYYVSVKKIYY